MDIIPVVVEQHAEEAAFQWMLRDDAVRQPHYDLTDLARLDHHVEAHLDGLRVNGEPAWEICRQQLEDLGGAGEVFAAAVLAYESGTPERIAAVQEIGTASLEASRGLISALGWLPLPQAARHIAALVQSPSLLLRRVGIAAAAIHRYDPPGEALPAALCDADVLLRARALRAAGELGAVHLLPSVRASFPHADESCRFWAAWSGALLARDSEALSILRATALAAGPFQERAVSLAARADDPLTAQRLLRRLQEKPEHLRCAVGDPDAIPWLIEQMSVAAVAHVAGESFSMITGADLAYLDLEGERPAGFASGPTEDAEDENVAMDPDENLPWPNPQLIQKWWESNKSNFRRGVRYLLGKPIEDHSLREALRTGYQRQRAAAALELALRQPSSGLFEVRAPGFRQSV